MSSVTMTAGANGNTAITGTGVVSTGEDGSITINGILFSYSGAIVDWTAPSDGTYSFVVDGAQGGQGSSNYGGYGAEVTGDIYLTAGEELALLVGGGGQSGYISGIWAGGGGGGSFVYVSSSTTTVPEPSSIALLGLGVLAMPGVRRKLVRR